MPPSQIWESQTGKATSDLHTRWSMPPAMSGAAQLEEQILGLQIS